MSAPMPRLGEVRTTGVNGAGRPDMTRVYFALSDQVRAAGLLRRAGGFYATCGIVLAAAFAAVATGSMLLGDSWWQLGFAVVLGILFTQVAFIAHEAAHGQIFADSRRNEILARVLANGVVGMSYSWWMNKHTRHHGNPNQVARDPDIEIDVISFTEDDARTATGLRAWITRRQGWLFFPLLTLEGVNLHYLGFRHVLSRGPVRRRSVELSLLIFRFLALLTPLFMILPWDKALAFWAVQLIVVGLTMGASFAPNHKGMPLIAADARVDFFTRQVITSRNVAGGWWASLLYGGLNYQIEHHLFPTMARPHLAATRDLVRAHCLEHGVPYTETTMLETYRIVVGYLNRVGLAARDPFDCPARSAFRPR